MNKFSKHELTEEEKMILDSLPIATEVYEIEGKNLIIMFVNKAAIDVYDSSYEELIPSLNDDLYLYIHPDDKERAKNAVEYALENGLEGYDCTYRTKNRRTNEYFWMNERGKIVKSNGVKFLYVNHFSLGEYQELYLKNEEISLNDEYVKAGSFRSVFLARLSHNMRTPMNAIINLALFGEKEESKDVRTKYFKKIKASGEYLLGTLNDMLDLQTLESDQIVLKPEVIEYKENMNDLLDMYKAKAKNKDIELTYVTKGNIPENISIDKYRFNQIISNLLSNAIKYTPNFGKVSLKTEIIHNDKGETIGKYSVIDNGIGMSKGFIDVVFNPFAIEKNQLMDTHESSGLGLYIVKNLVEQMSGKIWVNSVYGKGSIFVFTIPLIGIMGTNTDKNAKVFRERKLKNKKILIVDDNEINVRILEKIFKNENCEVVSAYNGLEAIEKYKRHDSNYFDAVIMDVKMPIMDGYTSTKRIREENSEIPIIMLSANAYKEDVKLSLSKGANAHLSKPIDKVKLLSTLEFFL